MGRGEPDGLQPVAEGLWIAAAPQRFLGIELGTRMTVVRVDDGSLLLHSPIRLAPLLREALDRLGPVRAVIAPNLFHHLYAGEALAAFPGARLYACPGLARKRPDLPIASVLDGSIEPWAPRLRHCHVRGNAVQEEVVSYHAPSRTLLVADLVGNLELPGGWARIWGALNGWGRFGPPNMLRLMMRDRAAARASIRSVLAWDFDRVIVTHGAVLESGGRAALESGFAWLLR